MGLMTRRIERANPMLNGTQSFITWAPGGDETIQSSFQGYVNGAMKSSGPIFSLVDFRAKTFAEAVFAFRPRVDGRPQNLFTNDSLAPLYRPWPGARTGELLLKMLIDVDMAGTAFVLRVDGPDGARLKRLRPDWVTIMVAARDRHDQLVEGSADQPEAEIQGYLYAPGGMMSSSKPRFFLPDQVAYWAPTPDPAMHFRGMSWLTPIIMEIEADLGMTLHKKKFLQNAATPNLLVKIAKNLSDEDYGKMQKRFGADHGSVENAWKTLILEGGADATVIGADFKQLSYHTVQAIGESRMAAAAGVPPVLAGFSEGLQAATYSNYSQARRRYADGTLRPLWRGAAGALEQIIPAPELTDELWYDDRDIPFLREDEDAIAKITSQNAATIGGLVINGFTAKSAVTAVTTGDMTNLEHSGLPSIQLQPKEITSGDNDDNEN